MKKILFFVLVYFICILPAFASGIRDEMFCDTVNGDSVTDDSVAGDFVPKPDPAIPEFAEPRPEVSTRDELTVSFSKSEVELDFRKSYLASEAQLYTAIYEGLFSYHPLTMAPVPAACEAYEISDDKKKWTFIIRQNAKYWNGDPVTAEDFRSAWISMLSTEKEAPYSSLFDIIEGAREYRTGVLQDAEKIGIFAAGPKTLVVKLNAPASFFPSMLCHHSFSPMHPSMADKENWADRLISNGPFRISEMDEDKIIFEKSDEYWDMRNVSLNKIIIKLTEDGDEASGLWNSGEARWIYGEVNFNILTDRSGIQVNAMFATHYYFIRSAENPWNDTRVRRALILALPWEELRSGHFLPAGTLIYPLPGYPEFDGLTETKIEEAAALLVQAGYRGGEGLPELVFRITPSPEAARIVGLMAEAWKELGLSFRVEVVPYGRYFQSLKLDGYTVGFSTWIGDFADPYTFLQMWRRDSNLNDARYDDDDYEALMEKSMTEEGEARWAILAEAEKLLLERGSVIPVSYSPAINIVDINELGGWFPNALDIHPFKYLYFRAFRPLPGVVMGR